MFDQRHIEQQNLTAIRAEKIQSGLPDIDSVPDWVYENTEIPQSVKHCNELMDALTAEIEVIRSQIESRVYNSDGWENKARAAITGKNYQKALLACWRKKESFRIKDSKREKQRQSPAMTAIQSAYNDSPSHANSAAAYKYLETLVSQIKNDKKEFQTKVLADLAELKKEVQTLYKLQSHSLRNLLNVVANDGHADKALNELIVVVAACRGAKGVDSGFLERIETLRKLLSEEEGDRNAG